MPVSVRRAGSWLRRAAAWMGLGERVCERVVRRPRRAYFPLALERLEDRVTPAQITYVWTNNGHDGLWSDTANWTNSGPTNLPIGDTAVLEFDSGTAAATPAMTDNIANLTVDEIHFAATGRETTTGYTIGGTATINLGGSTGVVVDSGVTGGTPGTIQDVFGSGITFNQHVASTFTNNDTGTGLVIDGAVTLNNFTLTTTGTYSSSGNLVPGGEGVTFGGVISQAGGLNLNGFTALNGPNTYTGTNTMGNVSSAVVAVGNGSGLGNASNTTVLTANSGSGLNLDGVSVTQANLVFNAGNAFYSAYSSSTWNGPITLEGGTETISTIGSGSRLAINGVIGGAGALSVGGLDVPGVVELEQNNTYTGVTTVGDIFGGTVAGTLQIDAPAGLGAGGNGNGTTVDAGSELLLAYTTGAALQDSFGNAEQLTLVGAGVNGLGALQMLNGAEAAIPGAVTLTGNTTIGVGTGSVVFDAAIGQTTTSALTVAEDTGTGGAGEVVFGASNTYTGATTVQGGTLLVDANEPGAITVAPVSSVSAALDGLSSVGAVTLSTAAPGNQGATLFPGAGLESGILTATTVTLDAGSTFNAVLNGPTTGSYSQLESTGTVTLNSATLTIDLGAVPAVGTGYTLIQAASVVGTFSNGTTITVNGYTFTITYTSTKVTLTFLGVMDFWTGAAGDGLWSDAGNWAGGAAPVSGATVVFETNLTTTAGGGTLNTGANAYNTVDNIPNLVLNEIVFDDGTAYSVHTAGSDDPFALGGAAQSGTTGYTVSGNASTGSLIITNTNAADGIGISSGVNHNNIAGFTETFAASVPISLDQPAGGQNTTTLNDADASTQLTINGTIAGDMNTNGILDVVVANASGVDDAAAPGVNLNGVISDAGDNNSLSIQKDGAGTLFLGAVNTYTGPIWTFNQNINSGVVIVAQSNANGSGLGANSQAPPGLPADTIVNGQSTTTAGQVLLGDGVTVNQRLDLNSDANGGGVAAYGGALATWAGPVQLDVVTTGGAAAAPAETIGAGVSGELIISGVISGGGDTNNVSTQTVLYIEGDGAVQFAADNTYFGQTIVGVAGQGASVLIVERGDGLGQGDTTALPTQDETIVTAGSVLDLDGGITLADAASNPENLNLAGAGINNFGALEEGPSGVDAVIPGDVTLSGDTTVSVGGGALTFESPIGESVSSSLTIVEASFFGGAGGVVFLASNTYSGGTTVAGSTLEVDASEPGNFTIAPTANVSAALDGNGTVGTVIYSTLASGALGGTLAPNIGLNTETLNAASVTLDQGSIFSPLLDLGSNSQLVCNGLLTIGGATLNLELGAVLAPLTTLTIVQATAVSGFFSNAPTNGSVLTSNGLQIRINYTSTAVTATILTNPTLHTSSVYVTQAGQAVTLGLAVQLPPGSSGVSGTATFTIGGGGAAMAAAVVNDVLTLTMAVTFDQTTDQAVATVTTTALPAGVTTYTTSMTGSITGAAYATARVGGAINDPSQNPPPSSPSVNLAIPGLQSSPPTDGVPYQLAIAATGGDGNYVYQIAPGSEQPNDGLILVLNAGVVSITGTTPIGAPSGGGTCQFTISVTDPTDPANEYQVFPFSVNILPPNIIVSTNGAALPAAQQYVKYTSIPIAAFGGYPGSTYTAGPAYTFTDVNPNTGQHTLPAGLMLTATQGDLNTVEITGTATTATPANGTTVMITATDMSGENGAGNGPYSSLPQTFTLIINPTVITVGPSPSMLPAPKAGVLYGGPNGYQLTASDDGVGSSFDFKVPPNELPPGMSLSPAGVLSGAPTETGQFPFTISATDAGNSQVPAGSQPYTIIVGSPSITLSPSSSSALAVGTVNSPYPSQTITASGGTAPYSFTLSAPLPDGLTYAVNAMNGTLTISGTPKTPTPASGSPVTVTVTDSTTGPGMPFTKQQNYTFYINSGGFTMTPDPSDPLNAQVGQSFNPQIFTFTPSGGVGPYTFKLLNVSPANSDTAEWTLTTAPDGLSATLSGTPTFGGTASFTIQVTDDSHNQLTNTFNYSVSIPTPTIAISPGAGTLPTAVLNAAYTPIPFSASGGTAPYTFQLVGAKPPGMLLSPAGVLSGTPTAAGSYSFSVQATDSSLTNPNGGGGPYPSIPQEYTLVVSKFAGAPPVVLNSDGSLTGYDAEGKSTTISQAGSIQAVSAVTDAAGKEDVFVISKLPGVAGTLWEYSGGNWAWLSTGSFQQISAVTNAQGRTLVYAVVADGTLWENDPANGTGLNQGWTELSTGFFLSISPLPTPAGVLTYAVVANGTLWEQNPAFGTGPDQGWTELSTGSFQSIDAGVNGAGQPVIYGLVAGGSLWEQDPATETGTNQNWSMLSGAGGAPAAFLGMSAGASDKVFAVAADHTLWLHGDAGWTEASSGPVFTQVTGSTTAASDEAFAVLSDGSLWWYSSLAPGNWVELMTSGVAAVTTS